MGMRVFYVLVFLTVFTFPAISQIAVKGTVKDKSGLGVIGASIVLKGTTNGTITDVNGNFSIKLPKDSVTLIVSSIGFEKQEVTVFGQTTLSLIMTETSVQLNEFVAIGYGTVKKKDLTGAIATVSSKDFKQQNISRIDQVLQGRVSGVNVQSNSGLPGSEVKIRVRGSNSITGNNNPLFVIDGYVGGDMAAINPEDIESMQVLKDASATAIYGSRGSNGVILITTKRGKKGDTKIEFTTRQGWGQPVGKWDVLNAQEFVQVANEYKKSIGASPAFNDQKVEYFNRPENAEGTDWQDLLMQTSRSQEYQLSVSGGGEKSTYLVSGNYNTQNGIIINSFNKKSTLRLNLDTEIKPWLKFTLNNNVAASNYKNVGSTYGDGMIQPYMQSLRWSATTPAYDTATAYPTRLDDNEQLGRNPLWNNYEDSENKNLRLNSIAGFLFTITKGLELNINGAVNYDNYKGFSLSLPVIPNVNTETKAWRYFQEGIDLLNTNTLTYNTKFGSQHALTITGVAEFKKYESEYFGAAARNLTDYSLGWHNLANGDAKSRDTYSGYYGEQLSSYLSRVNYTLKNRYMLTASVRYDGSSKFSKENRWSFFPSAAFAWRASDEEFVKNLDIFHSLKFRASWGRVGNQAIYSYQTLSPELWVAQHSFDMQTITQGVTLGNKSNPDLKWETTEQFDIGVDMAFLDGRIAAEVDWYSKVTDNLLMAEMLPAYLGGGTVMQNIGVVNNSGIDLQLTAFPLRSSQITWESSLNFSYLNNEVEKMGRQDSLFYEAPFNGGIYSGTDYALIKGMRMGNMYGFEFTGIYKTNDQITAYEDAFNAYLLTLPEAERANRSKSFKKPSLGDAIIQDANGDFMIDDKDLQVIGNGMPKFTFGFNNTIHYKGFTMNLFFQGVAGVDRWNTSRAAGMTQQSSCRYYSMSEIRDRFVSEDQATLVGIQANTSSNYPGFSPTQVSGTYLAKSTLFIENGSYLRLKNLSLAYDIPSSIAKYAGKTTGLRVFASVTNALTITKYKGIDPESTNSDAGRDTAPNYDSGSIPNSRTFTIGATLRF